MIRRRKREMEKEVEEEKEKGRKEGGTKRKRRGSWRGGDGAPLYVQPTSIPHTYV
jgi:hypothetical protein